MRYMVFNHTYIMGSYHTSPYKGLCLRQLLYEMGMDNLTSG